MDTAQALETEVVTFVYSWPSKVERSTQATMTQTKRGPRIAYRDAQDNPAIVEWFIPEQELDLTRQAEGIVKYLPRGQQPDPLPVCYYFGTSTFRKLDPQLREVGL